MTREQKDKELFCCEKFIEDYGTTREHFYKCLTIDCLIDKIYDYHEAQLKTKDDEIERLEKYITDLEYGIRMLREARKLQG